MKQLGELLTPEMAGYALVDLVRADPATTSPGYLLTARAAEAAMNTCAGPGAHRSRAPVRIPHATCALLGPRYA